MLGEYSELLYFLPILIRIAVGIIILAVLYDWFRRKWARMIVDAVKAAGADSPESAISTAELTAASKMMKLAVAFLLRKHSPLRRYVKCTLDDEDEFKFGNIGADGTSNIDEKEFEGDKKALKAIKKAEREKIAKQNKIIEKSFSPAARKLTGHEEWYIEPYSYTEDENGKARNVTPYLLRDGAEPKVITMIVGCIGMVLLGEIFVYFLPQIMDFFVKLAEIKK